MWEEGGEGRREDVREEGRLIVLTKRRDLQSSFHLYDSRILVTMTRKPMVNYKDFKGNQKSLQKTDPGILALHHQ